MNKHTQDKWNACCLDNKPHFVFAGEDKTICCICMNDPKEPNYESLEGVVTKEECVANAKLIQAAPELLDALQELLNLDVNSIDIQNRINAEYKAKEAIKKATE